MRCRDAVAGEESAGVSWHALGPVEAEIIRDPLVTDLLIGLVRRTVALKADASPPRETPKNEEDFAVHYPFTKPLDPGTPPPPARDARGSAAEAADTANAGIGEARGAKRPSACPLVEALADP